MKPSLIRMENKDQVVPRLQKESTIAAFFKITEVLQIAIAAPNKDVRETTLELVSEMETEFQTDTNAGWAVFAQLITETMKSLIHLQLFSLCAP